MTDDDGDWQATTFGLQAIGPASRSSVERARAGRRAPSPRPVRAQTIPGCPVGRVAWWSFAARRRARTGSPGRGRRWAGPGWLWSRRQSSALGGSRRWRHTAKQHGMAPLKAK